MGRNYWFCLLWWYQVLSSTIFISLCEGRCNKKAVWVWSDNTFFKSKIEREVSKSVLAVYVRNVMNYDKRLLLGWCVIWLNHEGGRYENRHNFLTYFAYLIAGFDAFDIFSAMVYDTSVRFWEIFYH